MGLFESGLVWFDHSLDFLNFTSLGLFDLLQQLSATHDQRFFARLTGSAT